MEIFFTWKTSIIRIRRLINFRTKFYFSINLFFSKLHIWKKSSVMDEAIYKWYLEQRIIHVYFTFIGFFLTSRQILTTVSNLFSIRNFSYNENVLRKKEVNILMKPTNNYSFQFDCEIKPFNNVPLVKMKFYFSIVNDEYQGPKRTLTQAYKWLVYYKLQVLKWYNRSRLNFAKRFLFIEDWSIKRL